MYYIALVSSKKQQSELINQKEAMITFLTTKGLEIDEIICALWWA